MNPLLFLGLSAKPIFGQNCRSENNVPMAAFLVGKNASED